jgi:hypothetical protein
LSRIGELLVADKTTLRGCTGKLSLSSESLKLLDVHPILVPSRRGLVDDQGIKADVLDGMPAKISDDARCPSFLERQP